MEECIYVNNRYSIIGSNLCGRCYRLFANGRLPEVDSKIYSISNSRLYCILFTDLIEYWIVKKGCKLKNYTTSVLVFVLFMTGIFVMIWLKLNGCNSRVCNVFLGVFTVGLLGVSFYIANVFCQ